MKIYILEYGKDSYYTNTEDFVRSYCFKTLDEANEKLKKLKDRGVKFLPKIKTLEL